MKRFHSMLIAIIALVLFAPLAQVAAATVGSGHHQQSFQSSVGFQRRGRTGPGDRACLGAVARRRNPTNLV